MVTRSFEIATPSALRRALLSVAALALMTSACDSGDSNSGGNAPGGTASIKFCHSFYMGTQAAPVPFEMVLQIGNPPVRLSAMSGKCSTDLTKACTTVPSGINAWRLLVDNQSFDWGQTGFYAGEQFVFVATPNSQNQPAIVDLLLDAPDTCSAFDVFQAAGTTPPTMMPTPGR